MNDILFGMIGTIGNIALIRENPDFAIKNVALIKDIKKINYLYLYQYLQSNNIAKQFDENMDGGTQKFIALNKVRDLSIMYPTISEQIQIGGFLEKLDNLITLHHRKFSDILVYKLSTKFLFLKFAKNVWEQRKLGEIGNTFTGLSGKTKEDFGHGEAKFVTYMNVFSNPIAQLNKTEPIEIDNKQNQVEYGDIFFTTSSETPDEVGMSSVWLENKGNIYLNSFCFGFRPFIKNDPYYMAYMLRANNFRKNMTLLAQGISRYNISKAGVMNIDIQLPNNQEQERIGKLFNEIDNLITLHHRKYTYIFYSWEQRKLDDITQIIMGQSPNSINYTNNPDDTILIQGNADLNNGIVVPRIWSSQITKKSYPNDIIFTVRAPVGEIARNPYFATIGRGVASFKGNDFLYQSLIQKKENNYWNNISAGSTFDSINSEQLKNVIIDLPKNDAEQVKIGELFHNLDNLITLHQHKELKRRNDNNEHLRW